jgi:hypothetical protein
MYDFCAAFESDFCKREGERAPAEERGPDGQAEAGIGQESSGAGAAARARRIRVPHPPACSFTLLSRADFLY